MSEHILVDFGEAHILAAELVNKLSLPSRYSLTLNLGCKKISFRCDAMLGTFRWLWVFAGSVVLVGCGHSEPERTKMPPQSNQKIEGLTEADQQRLRDQRAVVEKHLATEDSKEKYKTAAGKLGTIRAVLQGTVFKPEQTYELQCLGVILGDAFVQELGMQWIMVEDEHGRDPAVGLPNTTIILYPLTMIAKRVERGDQVDVFELFNGVAAKVDGLQRHAK